MRDRVRVAEVLDNLRAASLDASEGVAYVCGPPWFRTGSGVLVGSPDPHAGQMIADTDTSLSEPDDHDEIDDDCNALFLAEAWNFARMILGSPDLLDALRSADTGRAGDVGAHLIAKAEGQVAYWRQRQHAEKCLEDGISEDGETYTPIGDSAAWQGGYCNGRMSEADWWLSTLQHLPAGRAQLPDPTPGQDDQHGPAPREGGGA